MSSIDFFLFAGVMSVAVAITLFTLDDLFVDFIAISRGLKPRELKPAELSLMRHLPRKRIAILVANWHEEDVLEYMIRGNVQNIQYENYTFFLGVYPNDTATWEAARRLEEKVPNVSVIVNSRPGPTSKGQLLNEMVRRIVDSETITGVRHDLFLLQDSEDLIHPLSLQLINLEAEAADFVQVPVFSLPTKGLKLVAGVYMDEFAESHTKEMLVRASLGAPIPSAGVGTALSRDLVQTLLSAQSGSFLNEDCLTEDYQLGLLSARLGYRATFACTYMAGANGEKDFIATREYFPEHMMASVRQKTRWTVGIAFQSAERFGWVGNLVNRYFLWRDRRGPLNAILFAGAASLGLGLLTFFLASGGQLPAFAENPWFGAFTAFNLSQMLWRIGQRVRCTWRVYGPGKAMLVPLRWPVGNVVNAWASWRAFRVYRNSVKKGERPAWVKTQHKLPEQFGRLPLSLEGPAEEMRA